MATMTRQATNIMCMLLTIQDMTTTVLVELGQAESANCSELSYVSAKTV